MNLPSGYNEKLYQLLEESNSLKFSDPKKALELANFVYVQSLKSADETLEAKSLYTLGVCNELVSNYPEAMKFLSEAIRMSQKLSEKELMGDALNCVGIINDNLNNYSNALKSYFRALKIYEQVPVNKKVAIVLSNIGLIYTNIKDFKNALKFYSQALDIAEEEDDKESLLVTHINIGLTHSQLGNYDQSLKFLDEALELATSRNDRRRTSIALDHIAETNIALGSVSEAYRLFEQSRKIKLELDDKKGLVKIYGTVGQLNLLEDNIEGAKKNLHKALDLATELGMKKSIYELHKSLSEAYEKVNDAANALYHIKLAYRKELELIKEESELKAKNISTQLEIEQAQKEAEIQRLKNIELAKALEDVKKLNISLKELNEEKNEFMAIAVHDLKNPLQNILSTARVMKRSAELPQNEMLDFTSNIISQTDRMFGLIKKLLDHNAIEQGEVKIRNSVFEVNVLAGDLINNFKEEAEKKSLILVSELLPETIVLYTDKDILYEILQNILSNAIKFSPAGKTVFFRITDVDNYIQFEIKDEGPGFTQEDKMKMFAKFARLSAKPTGNEHSTGLGLSIVKKLCGFIGAKIKLTSEAGSGAGFTVSIEKRN
jgi:signal transduction histidine kinase